MKQKKRERVTLLEIRKLLRSLPLDILIVCIGRLLQKTPDIHKSITSVGADLTDRKRKEELISALLDFIKDITENPEKYRECKLSYHLIDYYNFIDLLCHVYGFKGKGKQWQTYRIQRFNLRRQLNVQLDDEAFEYRIKLRGIIKAQGNACKIQAEVINDRIWFRIQMVKKSKDRRTDLARLQNSRCYYVIYFSGEPYLYSTPKLSENLSSALAQCMGFENANMVLLSGKDVDSLRQMRLLRDNKCGTVEQELIHTKRFTMVDVDSTSDTNKEKVPVLGSFSLSCVGQIPSRDVVRFPERIRKQPTFNITFSGQNVLEGVEDLVAAGAIDSDPRPGWTIRLPSSGRNVLKVTEVANTTTENWELASVLSAASTVRRW